MFRRSFNRAIAEYNFGQPSLRTEFIPMIGGVTKAASAAAGIAPPSIAVSTGVKREGVKVTTCSNGARVITHNLGHPQHVSIGAYIEAGAKFDPLSAPGLNYVFRWGLTTGNIDNSLFQIDRTVRAVGASMEHLEVRKRFVGLRIDARGDMWQHPVANLFTSVSAPRFSESDIERFRDTMDNILEERRWQAPREYTIDMLETIAFYKEPLGNPRFVSPTSNDACSHPRLVEFWSKYCTPPRVVYAGVNVEHNALVAAYENSPFRHSQNSPHHLRSKIASDNAINNGVSSEVNSPGKPSNKTSPSSSSSSSSGGGVKGTGSLAEHEEFKGINEVDLRPVDQRLEKAMYIEGAEYHEQENRAKEMGTKPDMDPETIVAVGYQACGWCELSRKDYAVCCVIQQLMNVVMKDGIRYEREEITHHGIRSFYRPYCSTGLIGFTVRAYPDEINKAIVDGLSILEIISKSFTSPSSSSSSSSSSPSIKDKLAVAKTMASVSFYNENLESRRDYCDFLGTSFVAINDENSILSSGNTSTNKPLSMENSFIRSEDILAEINEVTAGDVVRVLSTIVTASKPVMWVTGETFAVPSLRQLGY